MEASPIKAIALLRQRFCFDFVALGSTERDGEPLRWVHAIGATNDRYREIVLSPGRGIGGSVLSAGKAMVVADIEREVDPREYASFPIIFSEGLHSFAAYPLKKGPVVRGVLLCAFRKPGSGHADAFDMLARMLAGGLCGYQVVTQPLAIPAEDGAPAGSGDAAPDPYRQLTNREIEVFNLIARGYTNREIADLAQISVKTVEARRKNIYAKLGITTRAELVRCAIAHHLFDA